MTPDALPTQARPTATNSDMTTSARRWIPNALTLLRLVIAVAFFTLLSVWTYPAADLFVSPREPVWPYLVAALLFILAAITDAVDGPLARRWKVVSVFGRVMDPFADKVLVVGAFVMLAGPKFAVDVPAHRELQVSGVFPWMVVLILGRELLVTSIRAVLESEGKDFSATWSGKAKMILQACVIPFILVILGVTTTGRGTWGRWTIDIAVWATVAATVASGVPYVVRGFEAVRSKPAS